tara:strand:- start:79 stop:567 length:489 start_codon:yes stop_codon:yes gene_type:complete
MTDKNTEKVKVVLERMKKDETYGSYFSLVVLKYNREDFFKKNKSVSNWFKKLTNGKTKTGGIYNRDWFKKVDNGFHKKYINGNEIEIWLAFEGQSILNKTDLTTRILKLQPHPNYIKVGVQDFGMLKNHFSDLFETESSIEVFGNIKKQDITTFIKVINSNI